MIRNLLEPLVCERFRSDPRYREGHLRIVNALPYREVMGLHSPEMKQVAGELSKERGLELIRAFESSDSRSLSYEETVIWGYLINLEKLPLEQKFGHLKKYIPVLDNWAVCDSYCAHAKWLKKVPASDLLEFLRPWYYSKREFEVRFAVVASMCYLLDACLDEVFGLIDSLDFSLIKSEYKSVRKKPERIQEGSVVGAEPYYVRMAVAWLLATALAKYPEKTLEYVKGCKLPEDVIKLYVRKAKDSFRTREVYR